MKTYSPVKDFRAFIIRPQDGKGVVTLADQRKMKLWPTWSRARFCAIHFATVERDEIIAKLKAMKLSKLMAVTEITDLQWGRRWKDAETIPGTGIAATKRQLDESFIIGNATRKEST